MSNVVVFITGANTGLGLEVVKALYKSDQAYDIVIGSRKVENGDTAVAEVQKEFTKSSSTLTVVQVDVSSDDSITQALKTIGAKFARIDVLINNAGSSFDGQIASGKMTMREAWNASWDVNVAGTQVLTHEAVPLLLKSKDPRLMFVTSGTASIIETENLNNPISVRINGPAPAGWPKDAGVNPIAAYRSSKVGLNMMMRTW
jgi:NAD(P)-dependent dehydrogenase (short-subunit alcohol dehydrogenase family)